MKLDTIFATYETSREIMRCIMSKDVMRFDNPENRNERKLLDPEAPISEIIKEFINNCQAYTIGTTVCIDEMLMGFRGRCRFKIYIPNKSVKYGLKIMCFTQTSYLLNAEKCNLYVAFKYYYFISMIVHKILVLSMS